MVTIKRSETQGHQWIIELGKVQEGMDSEGVDNFMSRAVTFLSLSRFVHVCVYIEVHRSRRRSNDAASRMYVAR
jgi:preprotein translocase subunit SecG